MARRCSPLTRRCPIGAWLCVALLLGVAASVAEGYRQVQVFSGSQQVSEDTPSLLPSDSGSELLLSGGEGEDGESSLEDQLGDEEGAFLESPPAKTRRIEEEGPTASSSQKQGTDSEASKRRKGEGHIGASKEGRTASGAKHEEGKNDRTGDQSLRSRGTGAGVGASNVAASKTGRLGRAGFSTRGVVPEGKDPAAKAQYDKVMGELEQRFEKARASGGSEPHYASVLKTLREEKRSSTKTKEKPSKPHDFLQEEATVVV